MTMHTPGILPASKLLRAPEPDWLKRWGAFAAALRFEDLPVLVVERAKLVLLDSLGAIAAGAQEPETRALAESLSRDGAGRSPAIGTGRRLAPGPAALFNGTAGTMLELDEGNQFARGHPAIHVVPAALAAAQSRGAGGRELLTALVLGYEIGSRIGIASKLRVTMHPHGTWGTVGAALAVAALAGADRDRMIAAINAASSFGLSTSRRTMLEGATIRNSYAGLSRPARTPRLRAGGGRLRRRARRRGLRLRDGDRRGFPAGRDDGRARLALRDRPQLLQAPRRLPLHARRARRAGRDHGRGRPARPGRDPEDRGRHLCLGRPARFGRAPEHAGRQVLAALRARDHDRARRRDGAGLPGAGSGARGRARPRPPGRGPGGSGAHRPCCPDCARPGSRSRSPTAACCGAEALTNRGDTEDPYGPDEVRDKFRELAGPVWGSDHAERIVAAVGAIDEGSLDALLELVAAPPLTGRDAA